MTSLLTFRRPYGEVFGRILGKVVGGGRWWVVDKMQTCRQPLLVLF